MQALGPMKWLEPVNWKTLVDNCSDNYHVPTSHLASLLVQEPLPRSPAAVAREQFQSPNKHVFVNGHSLTFREVDDNTPRYVHGMSRDTFHIFQDSTPATPPWRERRPGTSARTRFNWATTASSRMGSWGFGWRFHVVR